jgi:hypothetical protein
MFERHPRGQKEGDEPIFDKKIIIKQRERSPEGVMEFVKFVECDGEYHQARQEVQGLDRDGNFVDIISSIPEGPRTRCDCNM